MLVIGKLHMFTRIRFHNTRKWNLKPSQPFKKLRSSRCRNLSSRSESSALIFDIACCSSALLFVASSKASTNTQQITGQVQRCYQTTHFLLWNAMGFSRSSCMKNASAFFSKQIESVNWVLQAICSRSSIRIRASSACFSRRFNGFVVCCDTFPIMNLCSSHLRFPPNHCLTSSLKPNTAPWFYHTLQKHPSVV